MVLAKSSLAFAMKIRLLTQVQRELNIKCDGNHPNKACGAIINRWSYEAGNQ